MSGRFFAAPLLVAVILLGQFRFNNKIYYGLGLTFLALGLIASRTPIFSKPTDREWSTRYELIVNGIADERVYYYPIYGLVRKDKPDDPPALVWAADVWQIEEGKNGLMKDDIAIGRHGYEAGPSTYVLDRMALVDPLMARLPVKTEWRIGHFWRMVPDGYEGTVVTRENRIVDENLKIYYDKLNLIISGEILDQQRLSEIWNINLGRYDYLLDAYLSNLDFE